MKRGGREEKAAEMESNAGKIEKHVPVAVVQGGLSALKKSIVQFAS